MMKRLAITAGVAVALGCAATRPPPAPPAPALCVQDRGTATGSEEVGTWTVLLLRGLDPATQRATTPALDCTGTQVSWDGPAIACDEDGSLARTLLPERPIVAGDVIVTRISPDQSLVWVVTNRFASGDALGPVALVETSARQHRVLAMGPLRAYPQRSRLRLETLGDRQVLVAEGEVCGAADPASCARAARLVPLQGDRFVPQPLVGPDGRCVSPAWFDLVRREPRPVGSRWERLDLSATLGFEGPGLDVDEQVVVHELASASRPATRVLRRAQAQRSIRWAGKSLAVTGPALLGQMSTRDAAPAP
jgi:hypothetical protein